MKLQYETALCDGCKKEKLYFVKGMKGKKPFWCESCRKARFDNPRLKIRLSKGEYVSLMDFLKKAEDKGLIDFRYKYDPKKGELKVIELNVKGKKDE